MDQPRRPSLSQHFLRNRELVDRLVGASSLSATDLVLEIGPGRGILTAALLQVAARVIAVEVDPQLCGRLRARFGQDARLTLVEGDFLDQPLPPAPFKVFASLPYRHTAAILRKLLRAEAPPTDSYVVVQREAAEKLLVTDGHNTLAALLYYPWWAMWSTHHFRRTDFTPPPNVDSVLLWIQRRPAPLLDPTHRLLYADYAADRFLRNPRAGARSPARFLRQFRGFVHGAQAGQLRAVRGAFARLERQQAHLQKIHRTRTDARWRRFGGN